MDDCRAAGVVKVLNVNPPVEKEIEKVLYNILHKEGGPSSNLAINKF